MFEKIEFDRERQLIIIEEEKAFGNYFKALDYYCKNYGIKRNSEKYNKLTDYLMNLIYCKKPNRWENIAEKLKNHNSEFYDVEDFVDYAEKNEGKELDDMIEDFIEFNTKEIKEEEALMFLHTYDKDLSIGLKLLQEQGFKKISEIENVCFLSNTVCEFLAKEELKELLKDL